MNGASEGQPAMKIFLVGEAATHADELVQHLQTPAQLVPLPREAAHDAGHDALIGPQDVVVSLRFARRGEAPPFRLLHVPGAGLDGIDTACLPPGCAVCNVFEHEIPIAEYVCLAMLEWQVRLRALTASFTAEAWPDLYRDRRPHGELHGKTLALIGLGRIGRAIAQRAGAFGMRVLAVDGHAPQPPQGLVERLVAPHDWEEALEQADFVAITCPLTPQTRGLFNARSLRRMRRDAVLINVSRAEIADERALYEALRDRVIGGAVLDVWYRYPQGAGDRVAPSDQPFLDLPNVIATPHSSAWTDGLPRRRYAFIARNIDRLVRGEPLQNRVRAP
ncbi:MAG TPA: 2-hydroxyacid dehydrogenase [Bordetella sp.]